MCIRDSKCAAQESKTARTRKGNIKKSDGILCSRNEVKYSFITQHKNTFSIRLMCQVLGVSRNGYYSYKRSEGHIDPVKEEMLYWVKRLSEESDYTYGSRRMKHALNALGYPVSRQKARKLMREAGVKVLQRKKYKVTTNSNHKQPLYENLLQREFDVAQANRVLSLIHI